MFNRSQNIGKITQALMEIMDNNGHLIADESQNGSGNKTVSYMMRHSLRNAYGLASPQAAVTLPRAPVYRKIRVG